MNAPTDSSPPHGAPPHLIAIDWGTSSLRAALVAPDGTVIDRLAAPDGIMFARGRTFPAIFDALFGPWRARHPDAMLLASGMIGSRQGWIEAPYVACPAGFEELASALAFVELGDGGRLGIVPGLRDVHEGVPDVMRGEEIQIVGALRELDLADGMFVLPGTHSKWARVEGGKIVSFRTFLSGEMFGLLRHHSILGRLMPEHAEGGKDAFVPRAFDAGVALAAKGQLLAELFSVRTHGLFANIPADHLPSYLSGLLIGEEVREALALFGAGIGPVYLVCRGDLATAYTHALSAHGIVSVALDDAVTFAGLAALARQAQEYAA